MELTQLGQKTEIPTQPDKAKIELIPFVESPVCVRFQIPEFTSLCPITSQPDFARLVIDYVPRKLLIESKSLKLYLNSFRNHGVFHEEVTSSIGDRLYFETNAIWLRIAAFFNARGGIPIDVFYQRGEMPRTVYIPDVNLNSFRGR
jgi:7-cyano-7-deazaguanine reductase